MGTLKENVGPLSYMIELPNSMVWKRHIDHIQEGGRSESNFELNLIVNRMFVTKNNLLQQLLICWNVGGLPVKVASTITLLLHQICYSK